MKNRMLMIAILVAVSCLTGIASAGSTAAKIDKILVFEGGMLLYIYPVGGVVNPPACHGSNGDYYSYKINRPMAKEYFAGLLAAQMSGSVVEFWGMGACIDQSTSETLRYFRINSTN